MNRNSIKYISMIAMNSVALLMMTGSVLQDFLLQSGVKEEAVTLFLSVLQIVQVGVMLVFSAFVDRVKNMLRMFAFSALLQFLLPLLMMFFCLHPDSSPLRVLALMYIIGIAANLMQAVSGQLSYKVPYLMIDMRDYGSVTAICGLISGILGVILSAVMTYFTARHAYHLAMLPFFLLSIALFFGVFWISIRTKPSENPVGTPAKAENHNLLKYKPFTALIIPNILRGISMGALAVTMTAGHYVGITDNSSGAVLTMLLQLATVLGCLLYSFLAKYGHDGQVILYSSIAVAVAMPLMFLTESRSMFYIMYFIANFFMIFVSYAIPFVITKFVDYSYIGQYTACRTLLNMLGTTIANLTVTWLLGFFGAVVTMLIFALCRVLSGLGFYLYLKRNPVQ